MTKRTIRTALAFLSLALVACGPSRAEYNRMRAEVKRLAAEDSALKAEVAALREGPSALLAKARMFYCERKPDSAHEALTGLDFKYGSSPQADSGRRLRALVRKSAAAREVESGGSSGSGDIVYVADSKSAWQYHANRSCIPRSSIVTMTRAEAIRRGFKPCAVCCPRDYEEQSPVEPPAWIPQHHVKPKIR